MRSVTFADARDEPLVEVDRSCLHAERIEVDLLPKLCPHPGVAASVSIVPDMVGPPHNRTVSKLPDSTLNLSAKSCGCAAELAVLSPCRRQSSQAMRAYSLSSQSAFTYASSS
jgi:hypothetical protein